MDLAECYKILFQKERTPSLKLAVQEQNIEMEGLWHTALDDAINTTKLLIKLLKTGFDPKEVMTQV